MPLTPRPDAAIFDFDGVIIDSLPAVASAINGALADHGLAPRPPAELARFIGPPTPVAFIELTGEPADSDLVASCLASYHERYERVYLEQTRLIDGIAEVLHALELPLALATAKELRFVAPLLDHFGITAFAFLSAPELAEPKARTVARAQKALGASEAVVVGDRRYDVEAAHACALRAIGVTWGVGDRAELHRAEQIVQRPAELLALLS
jgi:phosphoglycolate phosphatase